ncbi:MAG TPA: hypothetical protein VI197_33065 [Polyangiaceae bacterium]
MNTKSLRFITTAALSLALAAPATVLADGARNGKAGGPHAHADKNGDGVITQNEVPAQRWERLKGADSNKDGKITKDEMAAFFKAHKDARFKNADKNGDGALTQNEVPAQRWERLKSADSNKDSKVTKDELAAFFKTRGHAKHGPRPHGKPGPAPRS